MKSFSENTPQPKINLEEKDFSEVLPLQVRSETGELLPLKNSQSEQQEAKIQKTGAWKVFASTFVTIFLAEIGDKTQITTLLMTAESQSPWIVFLGAGSALVTTSLLGVLLGQWLASRLSPKTVERAAGIILLLISLTLIIEVFYENFPG
ncbi:MAG: TMEM165/GDT1 family protein [Okeania sp. SIO2C9]|uniref:TMEM165/GDT1 family protein n=1 Tax=Okeania sp. SIO2C9 TaxID=2607791 RepID=UPI0013C128B3|nr:TMEM165/GDT1 family protein [Okeania sp. SIO2C9]NEQ76661.1 TMEM165/GDT1 family protein [Okeania sp. SIO2C9]